MFIWINELQPARLSVPGDKAGLAGAARLLSIFAAMLPAAKAADSIPFQRVVWNQFAVPVRVEVCVPARSETETVADFAPVVCVVDGLNCTVTVQAAPGARVV
jgi:hypothetical protein